MDFTSVIKFFTSMKLAVVLLLVIISLCALASVVPQDEEEEFYLTNYSIMGPFILKISFQHFFRSILFFIPVICFFMNLFSCTLLRIFRRGRDRVNFRPGPDILHIGLLLIIVGGTISLFRHQETIIMLEEGQNFKLPGGETGITLREFSYYTYPDGRPRDWISSVEVFKNGESLGIREIEVNSPLSLEGYKIYQTSYRYAPSVLLSYEEGKKVSWPLGQGYWFEDVGYLVDNIKNLENESPQIFFTLMDGGVSLREIKTPGESIGPFTIENVVLHKESGFKVTRDEGSRIIMIALILMTAGLFLTFYQKLGDYKK